MKGTAFFPVIAVIRRCDSTGLTSQGHAARRMLNVLMAVLILSALSTCKLMRREKPATPETAVTFCFDGPEAARYSLVLVSKEMLEKKFVPAGPLSFVIPAMEGQIFDVFGVRYIDNDPSRFEVIQFRKDGVILRRLSLRDIEALPKGKDGCRLLSAPAAG